MYIDFLFPYGSIWAHGPGGRVTRPPFPGPQVAFVSGGGPGPQVWVPGLGSGARVPGSGSNLARLQNMPVSKYQILSAKYPMSAFDVHIIHMSIYIHISI